MSARKHCVFCGNARTKITKEHAWPNWIRPLLRRSPSTIIGTQPSKKPINFPGKLHDMGITANAVCESCNGGWMAGLENEVRPFLTSMIRDGAETALSRAQQFSLARWMLKTSMVFEFTHAATPFYTFAERDALRNGLLLGATVIWIGRYEGSKFMSTAVAKALNYDIAVEDKVSRHPGSGFTLSVGQFVAQVQTIRTPPEMTGLWVRMPRQFAESVEVLWPRAENEPVQWPPAPSLTDDTLNAFIERFVEDKKA